MAKVTGYTAAKMNEFNNASVVGGSVNTSGSLILTTRGGGSIDAGNIRGPQGVQGVAGITGGNTASRNAAFGTPSTTATQVALANRVVSWYNTQTGLLETYYGVTGQAGLTAPGLPVGSTPGWYENWYTARMAKGRVAQKFTKASTGQLPTGWQTVDTQVVPLVAGRHYRLTYKHTTSSPVAIMALGVELRIGTTDVHQVGDLVLESLTMYTAPKGNQGNTLTADWYWTATATGNFFAKVGFIRAEGTSTYEVNSRHLILMDEGSTPL